MKVNVSGFMRLYAESAALSEEEPLKRLFFLVMMTFLALSLLLIAALFACALKVVPDGQVHSLYRRGKLMRVLEPGTHMAWPLLDRVAHKIDLAGQTLRFEEMLADHHDVRGTVYWQVLEPERADAVFEQVDQLIRRGAQEALRNGAATDRRDLGTRVKQALNSALRERGMMVTRVELDPA